MWIPIAVVPAVAQTADPGEVDGRLDLDLDRQVGQHGVDGGDAAREVARATVAAVGRARRHDELAHTVEANGRQGDLGDLLGPLDVHRLAGVQRLLDRAEAAALVLGVAHARLHDGRGEDVAAVQPRDLLVRHAVGRRVVVEARAADRGEVDVDDDAVAHEAAVGERLPRGVGGHRQRQRRAVERPVPSSLGPAPARRRSGGAARRPRTGARHAARDRLRFRPGEPRTACARCAARGWTPCQPPRRPSVLAAPAPAAGVPPAAASASATGVLAAPPLSSPVTRPRPRRPRRRPRAPGRRRRPCAARSRSA